MEKWTRHESASQRCLLNSGIQIHLAKRKKYILSYKTLFKPKYVLMSRLHMRGLNTSIKESRFWSQAWLQGTGAFAYSYRSGNPSWLGYTGVNQACSQQWQSADGHITAMMLVRCGWPQCGGTPVPVRGCRQRPRVLQLVLGHVSLGQAASCQDFLWIP